MNISNPFSFLSKFGRKPYIGIDIGTASIKAVLLEKKKKTITLKDYGMLESHGHLNRVNDAIQTSSLKMLDKETAQLLSSFLDELRLGTKDVAASLPAFSAFTTLLDIPAMSSEETAQAMQYQAKQFVPLPLTEVTIDWIPVGKYKDKNGKDKQQVFLVSIPNEQIEKYKSIFSAVGLNLRFLEIETMSSARILTSGDPAITLIIDIGARSTAISVASNGLLRYSTQTDFAASSLTQAVSRGLEINTERAEELKRQNGLIGTKGEYEVSTLMLPYLDAILNEAWRVINAYESGYSSKIDRIILSGGGANLLGIEDYVAEQFNLPVLKSNPLREIKHPPAVEPFAGSLGPPMTVAIGLSARQFIEEKQK